MSIRLIISCKTLLKFIAYVLVTSILNNIYIIILQDFGEKAPRKKTTHKTDE
jgi:hypothetical protein